MKIASLSDLLGGVEEAQPKPRPLIEAQVMELQQRWIAYNSHYTLKPGDLVVDKHGLGSLKPKLRDTYVFILWRMLDLSSYVDQQLVDLWVHAGVIANNYDCVVAAIGEDGEIEFSLRELAALQPWEHVSHSS